MEYLHNKKLTPIAKTLRKNMTKEERKLWYEFLKNYPVRFLRQKIIGNYVVDFYCHSANLIIELDGSQHFEKESIEKDIERDDFLKSKCFSIIRIPNNEINKNFKGVCEYIDLMVKKHTNPPDFTL